MADVEFTLLKTKLVPQRTRSQLIERPRLITYLNDHTIQTKLIALYAPAGYGKSTLVSQYIHSNAKTVSAWYSLDDDDNNLDVFTQYFIASYQLASKTPKDIANQVKDAQISSANSKARLSALFDDISNQQRPVCFILDDFHLINSTRVLEMIEWILKSMPDEVTMIITSREKPNLSCLSQMRMEGSAFEIGAKELKLTFSETQNFIAMHEHIQLAKDSLETLYNQTEGWVAATQLAVHALQDHTNQNQFIKHFTGSDKDIVNYLGATVLHQQSKDLEEFFLYTSVLKRLCGELCQEVTGNSNAGNLLLEASKNGLFLFELDRDQTWFRYHHLFGDFLLSRFKSTFPEKFKSTALRAAHWCLKEDEFQEAIHYYLVAEEFETAIRLINERVTQLVKYQGQHEVLLRWIDKLPIELVEAEPELSICLVWSLVFTRNLEGVETVLEQIRSNHLANSLEDTSSNSDEYDWIRWNLEMLASAYYEMQGKAKTARQKTDQWLQDWPHADPFERGVVLGLNGASCIQTLDLKLGRKVVREAISEFSSCEAEYGLAWMNFLYSLILAKQGLLNESKHMLEQALDASNTSMGRLSLGSAILSLGLGNVCYLRNELEEARTYIDHGFLSIEEHGHVEVIHLAFLNRAKLLLRDNAEKDCLALLFDAETFGRRLNLSHYFVPIAFERIRLMMANGKIDEAKTLFSEYGFESPSSKGVTFTAYEEVLLSILKLRFCFAEHLYDDVIKSGAKALAYCQGQGLAFEAFCIGIIQLRAYFETGNENKAFRLLNKYIEMAALEQQVSVFIEEQDYLEPLWATFFKRLNLSENNLAADEDDRLRKFIGSLQTGLKQNYLLENNQKLEEESTDKALEPLSRKEKEILNYLDRGLSNKELADSLFVSVSTVKWHLTRIYSKLGVKTRIEAIKAFQENRSK